MPNQCPCNSGLDYTLCCQPFIDGQLIPSTPEQLMRSRYTAYSHANIDYIVATMRGPAAQDYNPVSAKAWAQAVNWEGLNVMLSSVQADKGYVEFIASYSSEGKAQSLHEYSLFHYMDGRWYYVDALPLPKRGRNDPCCCGSGKKFKQCCQMRM